MIRSGSGESMLAHAAVLSCAFGLGLAFPVVDVNGTRTAIVCSKENREHWHKVPLVP